MESLQLWSPPSPLFRPYRNKRPLPFSNGSVRIKMPVIRAALSKPTAEITPSVSSRETTLHSQSPPPPTARKVSPNSLQYPSGYLGSVPDRAENVDGAKDGDNIVDAMSYLTNILSSKVFSFKLRGAYNMMSKLSKDQLQRGVICSSAGNHAQGVALSAKTLGCDAVIVMPVTTPEIKWQSVERLGAKVVLVGDSYDEAQAYAKNLAREEARTFIPPFDHPDVIIGQGTVGMEIIRQMQEPLHAIFVPVGGGGLIAGIAAYVKRVSTQVKIIGVEPYDANAMALSLHHGERVMLDHVGGFADGVAVKEVGEETFRICKELVDGVVLDMFEEKRSILEPAGALALAGAKAYCKYYGLSGKNVVAITSGANMNFDKLRVVTELANVGRQQEAVFATVMPEQSGSFKQFCELLGPMNITEFKYRFSSDKAAVVLYSVGVHTVAELEAMQERMESSQLKTYNLTQSDLVKDHLRYLVIAL
ncbi:threonine dehydratase biosynthetic [Citrus sinensis]|nr:threonine dehydratase biosynthetic [Citrus sinensis]